MADILECQIAKNQNASYKKHFEGKMWDVGGLMRGGGRGDKAMLAPPHLLLLAGGLNTPHPRNVPTPIQVSQFLSSEIICLLSYFRDRVSCSHGLSL